MELEIRDIPEHIAYTAEYDVDSYDDFFDVKAGTNSLQDLEDLMHEDNPEIVVPEIPDDYNYFTHPAGVVPAGRMHVRYFDMVDRKGRDDPEGKYRFVTVPAVRAAVIPWEGPNKTVSDGIREAFALVKAAGLEIAGDTRVSAIHGPWDREDEREYLVEIQVPVKQEESMKILINGRFYTENPQMPWAEAVVIDGRDFAYVGTNEGAKAFAPAGTVLIDMAGKTIIPGILDGHTHPATVSKTYWFVRGPLTKDRDKLLANIREYAEKYPKEVKPYFYYESYFTETFGDKGPDKKLLDEIISDRPARIQDFGDHACWYNSVALDMLTGEDGKPHSLSPIGEPEFKQNEKGEYTGWCLEGVVEGDEGIFEAIGWRPESVMNDEMSKPLFDYFRQYGVMCMMDGFTEGDENFQYIYDLDRAGKLGMYYEGTSILGEVGDLEESIATLRSWQEKYTTDHIRCNTIKFFIDGTNEMGDCLSTEPFHNDPTGTNYGSAYATMEEIRDVLVRLNAEKIDFHVHTICDGAFRLMCDAVEEAQRICGDDWCIKVCLAHCEIIHPDDIHRVKELGIYIDYSTHWAGGYFGEEAATYLGRERWETMHDYTKVIADGGKVGFSSDVFSYQEAVRANPMIGMQVAMTRVDPWVPLDPERFPGSVRPPISGKLTIEQLIHGYTVINAERMRLDDIMGSIEAGKRANMVVFNEDIFDHAHKSPETFAEIAPDCTWFEGEERHIVSELKADKR